ncbi:hypothetical protein BGZ72_004756 [Mortierella alpina]|nr:hypothetical protein BGZ72_004756 [Mortierella alpina]
MARVSPDRSLTHSPARLEFGESERVHSDDGLEQDNEREPEINVNMRPSELRASLMARAKRSSAKMQQQQQQRRSESMPLEKGSRLSVQSNQRQVKNSIHTHTFLPAQYSPFHLPLRLFASPPCDSDLYLCFTKRLQRLCTFCCIEIIANPFLRLPCGLATLPHSPPTTPQPHINIPHGVNNTFGMEHSLSSAFESRLSVQSSTSSSLSGWAPRARSASLSSQSSNDSVNLDALIAEGSDINEECPLELEEADDVEWSRVQQQQQQQQQQALFEPVRSRNTTVGSEANMLQYDDHDVDQYWEGSDMIATEEDEEFDEALREFSQLAIKSSSTEVRGLAGQGRTEVGSTRFADGRNHFDLDGDYMDRPSGLRPVSNRTSTHSNYSSTSDRSTSSRLQAPSASRGQGSAAASGLRAPASRLAQPKSMLAQPKAATSSIAAPRTGIARPSGVPPPRTGSQAPKSGLQPPRAASALGKASSLAKPTTTGVARAGVVSNGARSTAGPGSRVPSKPAQGLARPSASKTQIATPGSVRRSPATPVTTSNRNSLLPAPSSASSSKIGLASSNGRTTPNSRTMTSPKRSLTQPSLLTSPTRLPSTRQASSSHLVSPTSSQSSTSSLPSLAHGSKDTVTPLSRRLSTATGTARQRTAATTGRSISMYGASSLLQHQDDYEYSVLTPPQSPSSKIRSRTPSGLPRSGLQAPSSSSRLVSPTVSTSRIGRPSSPASHTFSSRPQTPTSSLPVSRYSSGLVSPRAGRN